MRQIAICVLILAQCAAAVTRLVPSQYQTIQAGINAAVNGDTVLIADGTYTGTGNYNIDFLGKAIIVESENGAENCIIDCQNAGRGFYFHSLEGNGSILSGFSITNGNSSQEGGGIFCIYSSPTIDNIIFYNNYSSFGGGGIACIFDSDAIISNCHFSGNTCGGWGGAVFINDALIVLSYCIFDSNSAGGDGGAVFICSTQPVIKNCVFTGNSADKGGAVAYDIGSVEIYDCQFEGNFAFYWGGALYFKYGESIVEQSDFFFNNALGNGGAIAVNMAETNLRNCSISSNSSMNNGGGMFVHWSSSISIENCIVEGNNGLGGLYGDGDYSFSEISYSGFYDNEGGDFAGLGFPVNIGSKVMLNFNGDSCDVYHNIFLDPQFVNPTAGDFHLTAASPCIDAGDPASPLDPDSTIADIGAYYFDQSPGAITDLRITIQGNDVVLNWSPAAGAVSYNVYRSTEAYFIPGAGNLIGSTNLPSYIDTNIIDELKYFYTVTVITE